MQIPHTLKIGGKKFKVRSVKNLSDKDLHGGSELLGKADINKCVIYLSKNMGSEKEKEVILHEIMHVVDTDFNLNLGENKVNLLAIEILRIITDNKLNFLQ